MHFYTVNLGKKQELRGKKKKEKNSLSSSIMSEQYQLT